MLASLAVRPGAQAGTAAPAHAETHQAFKNPRKGWVIQHFDPVDSPASGLPSHAYVTTLYTNYLPWSALEPTEGVHDWSAIDALVDGFPTRKIEIGIAVAWPPSSFDGEEPMPAWARAAFTTGEYTSAGTLEPDWSSTVFRDKVGALIIALADRYYNPGGGTDWRGRVTGIDIATYGKWGEWYSNYNGWANAAAKEARLREFVDHYFDAFTVAPIPEFCISLTDSWTGAANSLTGQDPNAVKYALGLGATMGRRSIGNTETLKADGLAVLAANIDTVPLRGEWIGPPVTWISHSSIPTFVTTEYAIDHALDWQVSRLGWYVGTQRVNRSSIPATLPASEIPEAALTVDDPVVTSPLTKTHSETGETLRDYFQRRSGYRFHIARSVYPARITKGQTLRLVQTWYQRAVAKLYHEHDLRCALKNGSGTRTPLPVDTTALDAHTWAAGDTTAHAVTSSYAISASQATGVYDLQMAVVDSDGNPAMNLALDGKDTTGFSDPINDYGWYTLGKITVI